MKLALLGACLLLASASARAELKLYAIHGDQSTRLSGEGPLLHPGVVQGQASIDDPGDGFPILVDLELTISYVDVLDGTIQTGVPGTTVSIDHLATLQPSPNQSGTGSTTTSIHWGISGWTQSGHMGCATFLGNGSAPPPSACILLIGFEGTGPPLPLTTPNFTGNPWVFSADGSSFGPTPSVQITSLGLGLTRQSILWSGAGGGGPVSGLPALSWAGLAILGAALLFLGARALASRPR